MKKALLIAAVLAFPVRAQASYWCAGNVLNLSIQPTGMVALSMSGAGVSMTSVILCQVGATFNGVTSDACKAIHAQLLAASIAGRQVRLYFGDTLTCATHNSWSALTGWYYGPEYVQ